VTEELKSGRLVMLRRPDLPIMRKWYLLTPKNKEPTGATSAVVDFITKQNGAYLPKISN
jgi:DNA-binding transcriptional LysR family regulator